MKSEDKNAEQLDLLWGSKAIAAFLGTSEREVYYQAESGHLPLNPT